MRVIFDNNPDTVGGVSICDMFMEFNTHRLGKTEPLSYTADKYAENIPVYMTGFKTVKCDWCEKLITRKIDELKDKNYCSCVCAWQNKNNFKNKQLCK